MWSTEAQYRRTPFFGLYSHATWDHALLRIQLSFMFVLIITQNEIFIHHHLRNIHMPFIIERKDLCSSRIRISHINLKKGINSDIDDYYHSTS